MRHEHLRVTVDAGTKARIEEDLDGGETVEAWIADAIDEKLADDGVADPETASSDRTGNSDWTEADDYDDSDGYDEGFEYVDDCSI